MTVITAIWEALRMAFDMFWVLCSYASVALARSIFCKGGSFTNAMAFELASTNLVIELGIILIASRLSPSRACSSLETRR